MWTDGFQGRTVLSLDNDRANEAGPLDEWLDDPIGNMLTQVADEASEATTDRYESDFAIEAEVVRLWFGRVPPTSRTHERRDVLPELPSLRLRDFVADDP
jgi:hypothetical protein